MEVSRHKVHNPKLIRPMVKAMKEIYEVISSSSSRTVSGFSQICHISYGLMKYDRHDRQFEVGYEYKLFSALHRI